MMTHTPALDLRREACGYICSTLITYSEPEVLLTCQRVIRPLLLLHYSD